MRLAPGVRLGDYEILGLLGAGGMGEVYRARDGILNRDVAIKLVRADFCDNPDSLTRLRREARVLASINHPNVATLHELLELDDGCGLVMELVSGETLADLIRQRPFSVADTLRFGAQVAAALEAAHERGLVHRDLKPANIKITSDGHAKVLDFGLAKVDASSAEASAASTILTDQGAIVGTAPYMSPEQARGAAVDRRTDLWAFGCVLFEMLTGRRAFDGATHSDILVGILERDPDFSSLPPNTPPLLERLIRRCLTKDSRRRYRDAGDARLELEDAATAAPAMASPQMPAVPARAGLRMASVFALGTLLGGAVIAGWLRGPSGPAPGQPVQFAVTLPNEERLAATDLGEIAISPDGRNVVYVVARGGGTQLSIHNLGSAQSTPLRGTLNAVSPFFSPDGQWVGYFANGKLHKVAAAGGTPVPLCDAADGLGGSWSASGTIVFASATGSPLHRVADSGGMPVRATELDVSRGEFSHRWPSFLPDGETFLFSVGTVGDWDEAEVFAQGPDGRRTVIWKGGTSAKYLNAGYLSYGHKGAIWVVPFDAKRLKVTGTPQKVLDGIATSVDGAAQFSVSRDSTGVYVPANLSSSLRRLAVVQNGELTPLAAPLHAYVTPRVSPDGRRVVLGVSEAAEHIWLFDVNAASLAQLTFDAANRAPTWSRDGRVTFASNRNGALNLFTAPIDGNGQVERLSTSEYLQLPGSWSPDGATLALMEQNPATGRDIWLLRSGERTAFANSPADESAARFSPDGQWIAYVSNESGQAEVYVRPATGSAPARKASTAGGMEPVWRPTDGGALFYRANDRLMMVPMRGGVPTAAPRVAFDGMANAGTFDAAGYDVMPGVDRFLIITGPSQASAASQFRVILNWAPGAPAR